MKRKTVLRFGVALLSIGVAAIPGGSRISDKVVFAEELSTFESDDGFTSVAPEDAEGQDSTEDISTEDLNTQEPATDSETASEAPTLTSVALNIDPDAETIPVEFLDYVNNLDIYSVMLVYSDGTEKIVDQTDTCYDFSASFEDASDTEGIVHRTYHITVKDNSTGMVYNADGSIDFGKNDPIEIKTAEMTSVILKNQKKWVMVRSVPDITGRYAMNCDKVIATIYYAADGEEAVCAENNFELQQGITYNFLIKLN
nr:hypothetical protein [uncultured Blautia sp.]